MAGAKSGLEAKSKVTGIPAGSLRKVHHIALNVQDMARSKYFYGQVLGLHELTGAEVPTTLVKLVAAGQVCNYRTSDGVILDLFAEPDLLPPDPDPQKQFTRGNHLAFDIAPQQFDQAVATLKALEVPIAQDVVTRPTGKGFYIFDPDGFMVEIRCDPL